MEDRRRALGLPGGRRSSATTGALPLALQRSCLLAVAALAGLLPACPGFGAEPPGDPASTTSAAANATELQTRARMARDGHVEGDAARTLRLLEAAKDRSAEEHAILGEALWRVGRPADARKVWGSCATAVPCALAHGQRELRGGDRATALKVLTKALAKHKDDVLLRAAVGEALYRVGQDVAARKLLDPLADLYQDGSVRDTAERVAVARSLALNGYFKDANEVLADTVEGAADRGERKLVEGAWAELFLTKYNFRDADVAFRRVLEIDPHDEDALVGMTRIDLDSDHDIAKARARADAMLNRNPSSVPALALRAEVAMHDEDFDTAKGLVQRAAQVAPNHGAVLALRYTLAALDNDTKAANAALAAAHKIDPSDAEPLLVAARFLEMGHRYREVVATLQAAIVRDPDNWAAHAALGLGLSRMADDKGAQKHLELAYRNDPFNVRTANVLNVLYDGVLKHMVLLHGPKIDLRVIKAEAKAFEGTLLPFLQQSHDELSERYAMTPERPLQVEIFPTTEQFSVRTTGLPRLGAHAVCFGHLITSRSPSEEPFNWKLVLYHELAHVFHIQATGGRVPRWLTEGLAMRESERLDPRYHMIMERQLYDRWVDGELSPIATFNLAFSQARTGADIMMAYYQSFWLVKYLEQTHGFAKLRRLVAGHATGKPTSALIQEIYGQPADAIDRAFATWLGDALRRFDRDYRPSPATLQRLVTGAWAKRTPSEALQAMRDWAEALRHNDAAGAQKIVREVVPAISAAAAKEAAAPAPGAAATAADGGVSAIEAAGPNCALLWLGLRDALGRNARDEAVALATTMTQIPGGRCDGVQQRMVLAAAGARRVSSAATNGPDLEARNPGTTAGAKAESDVRAEVRGHLQAAAAIDPRDAFVVRMQASMMREGKDDRERRALLRRAMELDSNDAKLALQLAQLTWRALAPLTGLPLTAAGQSAAKAANPVTPSVSDADTQGLIDDFRAAARGLMETMPASRDAELAAARLEVADGHPHRALPSYQRALDRSDRPDHRRTIWCELAVAAERANSRLLLDEARQNCAQPAVGAAKGPIVAP